MRAYASKDVTYCTNQDCKKKCWRHVSHYRFNDEEMYWYMETCNREEIK